MWQIQSGFLTVWDLILPKNRYEKTRTAIVVAARADISLVINGDISLPC